MEIKTKTNKSIKVNFLNTDKGIIVHSKLIDNKINTHIGTDLLKDLIKELSVSRSCNLAGNKDFAIWLPSLLIAVKWKIAALKFRAYLNPTEPKTFRKELIKMYREIKKANITIFT